MDYPITIPGFEKQKLVWRAGLWKNSFLINEEIQTATDKKKQEYSITNDVGTSESIRLELSFGDSVPIVHHKQEIYHLAKPISTGQKIFAGLLHLPLFAGGAVGGGCAALGFMTSLSFYRSKAAPVLQYAMVLGTAITAWLVYLGVAGAISTLISS